MPPSAGSNQPQPVPSPRGAALDILRALRDAGHTAYFAGGCVRDELLGREPDDYDVATDAPPPVITRLFPRSSEVGASFGVVIVRHAGHFVEVATFRSDGEYSDRRRPDSVRFASPEEDARRRDYTVNALFLDPLAEGDARVIDFVGGRADLAAGILRAVGDPERRLAEDHLRALRAARLAAKLAFSVEPSTAAAIRLHARDLEGVSRERVGDEVLRMLDHPARARAAAVLADLGLAGPVFHHTGPLPTSYPHLAALREDVPPSLGLAAWALDLGTTFEMASIEDATVRFRHTLCLSNEHRDGLRACLKGVVRFRGGWLAEAMASQKRSAVFRWFPDAVRLLEIVDPPTAQRVLSRLEELSASWGGVSPVPLLNGDELTALGLPPGPRFKPILDRVYDEQLEGRIRTPEQARAAGMRLWSEPG